MKTSRIIFLVTLLLAGCGGMAVPSSTTAVPPTTTPAAITAAAPMPTSANRPERNSPIIDGTLSPGEWDMVVAESLNDGSELRLMQDDDYLYLGIRAITSGMIGANIFVEVEGQVRILHTSAALGTAVYQQNANTWQQTQPFDWQCRDTGNSATAQAERAAYLQENGWLAANSRMGTPNELEYQIEWTGKSQKIAVSVFRSSAPNERVFWPSTLTDATIQPNPGGLPTELHFSLEQWAVCVNSLKQQNQ